jgi:hypothetical protein
LSSLFWGSLEDGARVANVAGEQHADGGEAGVQYDRVEKGHNPQLGGIRETEGNSLATPMFVRTETRTCVRVA